MLKKFWKELFGPRVKPKPTYQIIAVAGGYKITYGNMVLVNRHVLDGDKHYSPKTDKELFEVTMFVDDNRWGASAYGRGYILIKSLFAAREIVRAYKTLPDPVEEGTVVEEYE